jgi:hypothetical protein
MKRFFAALAFAACIVVAHDEARAAVAFANAGAVATGSTALNVPHPTGVVAGDLLVLAIGNKYPTNGPATPAGWTLWANALGSGGVGTPGNDRGPVYSTVFVKVAVGGETGNLAVSIPSGNSAMGRMFRYTKAAAGTWGVAATNGADNTAGTDWSVTGAADPGIAGGDMVVVVSSTNGNAVRAWVSESVAAAGLTFGTHTERQDSNSGTGNDMTLVVSDHTVTSGCSTAAPVFTMTATVGAPTANTPTGASVFLRIRELNTTTLATGSDPSAQTIAPGSGATDVDLFTLQTNNGTEGVCSVTVNLSTGTGVGRLAITDNAGAELGFTTTPVTGANVIAVTGMSATTALTTFKVRATPLVHASMPAVPGASYAITAPVTAWAGPNTHAGSDTDPNALTIDNQSPGDVSAATATAGVGQVSLSWTNPADADVVAGGTVLVLRRAGAAVADVPTEGTTYSVGGTVGSSIAACVVTGSPPATSCVDSGLTGGTQYYYKIFAQDNRGNYSTPGLVPTGSPATPTAAVSTFDACEVLSPTKCDPATVDFNRLFTKLASTTFSLDLVALTSGGALSSSFAGTVSVDLLANTTAQAIGADNCPTGVSTATIPIGSAAFSGGRLNVSVATNAFSSVAPNYSAYRDVRVRMTCSAANCPPSGLTRCSADNFAVRPTNLMVAAPVLTNTAQTGAPSASAGSDFTLTASAVTATAAAAAGYTGQPALDRTASTVATHVGDTDFTTRLRDSVGTNTITFPAAVIGTGVSTATLQYHEAGNFKVLAGGLVDSSFTAVDDPTKDCVSGSSSNADNDGNANNGLKYGCNVGNQSNSSLFGRFYPGYYTLTGGSVTAACVAGGYSYMGHSAMGLGFAVSAMSLDNPVGATQKLSKYTSGYATLASVNVLSEDGTVATDLTGNLSPSLAYNSSLWSSGDYVVSGSAYSFARTTPTGPYDSFYIGAGVTDADGAALNGRNFKLGDPACTVSCTHKLLSATPTKIRFGRLRLLNAIGAENLNLPLTLHAEYWNGSGFLTNTLDSCTALTPSPAKKFVLFGWQGGVNSANMVTPTAGTDGNVSATGTFVNGVSGLSLLKPSPPTTSAGSVRICLDLDSGAGGDTSCQAVAPANLTHLQGNWDGSASYNKDPSARSALGLYGAQPRQFIFFREGY